MFQASTAIPHRCPSTSRLPIAGTKHSQQPIACAINSEMRPSISAARSKQTSANARTKIPQGYQDEAKNRTANTKATKENTRGHKEIRDLLRRLRALRVRRSRVLRKLK